MDTLSDKQKKYLKIFWIIFLTPITLLFLLFFLISMGWVGFMPSFEDLENPTRNVASEIHSEDGRIIGTFYLGENRNIVEYKDLSPYLVQSLIAREDHRFRKHSGIDGWGLLRVAGKTILLGNKSQGGGSTITQQLAKQLFRRDTTDYKFGLINKMVLALTKFKEWVIAVKLERHYSKEEIITMYLNMVPFGSDDYGVKVAARTFFNKSTDSLKVEEAAMLIGMLQATTKFNPKRNPERARLRRNSVLEKMYEQDYLTKSQYDSLAQIPIRINYQSQAHDVGLATYFREYLRKTMTRNKPEKNDYYRDEDYKRDSLRWAEDPLYGWCNKNFKPDGSKYNLYKDGLKIRTTIDSRMQAYAEQALREHLSKKQAEYFKIRKGSKKGPYAPNTPDDLIFKSLTQAMKNSQRYRNLSKEGYSDKDLNKIFKTPTEMRVFSWNGEVDTVMTPWDSLRYYKYFLRASFIAVDPHTGHIKAYVGGPDYRYFQYDGVMDQRRQIGSTIKPFLYTIAMQEGDSPCEKVLNSKVYFNIPGDTAWSPNNSEDKYDDQVVTLKFGLAHSINNISAWLMKKLGPQPLVDILHKAGVKSDIPAVPSLCVGVPDISLSEMAGAYTIFPNQGEYTQPILVTQIEDKNGNVLTTIQPQKVDVINKKTAYIMTQMLVGVVQTGTAWSLRGTYKLMNEIGGKTGTTDDQSDGWFMGITPDLVAGAWVGGDERTIHFNSIGEGGGSAMALPIFGLFMQKAYADRKLNLNQGPFIKPDGVNVDLYCPKTEEDDTVVQDEPAF